MATAAIPADAAPLIAGRFAIEALAGSGGMGAVYRAADTHTGMTVAVKLLHRTGTLDDAERFEREARLLSEMRHPGIVTYVAHGTTEADQPFLAMEWLEGEDLTRRIERGPLPLEEALALLRRVAEALGVAHGRGVVHRDLKPGNLYLRGGDLERVTLLDFGIARRASGATAMTRTGMIIGTPAYMAPEQASGQRQVTAAADVFALGCVFFECLTGQTPFLADHLMATLARIIFDDPTPLRSLRPDLPETIDALVMRMLAKAPEDRFADASALLASMNALDDLRPAAAQGASRGREQLLLSVLMATPPPGLDASLGSLTTTVTFEEITALHAELAQRGARPEVLADGSLVATLRHARGVATDQAAEVARCALLIRARWPSSTIAVSTGRGLAAEHTAAGEVFDRAAALLRAHAGRPEAEHILLDEVTAGLLDVRFVMQRAGSGVHLLRGEEAALDAARPLLGKPTPCVGRDIELGMLESALAATAGDGELHAVLVIAPAGAGKSRLRHELVRRVAARGEEVTTLVARASPLGAGASYGLLAQAIRQLCGVAPAEGADAVRAKLTAHVAQRIDAADRSRVAAFLGELCGAPSPLGAEPRLHAARQDPQIMSDQITQAALDLLRADLSERPALLVLEDLHWGDAPTIQVVDAMIRELSACPLMVLALARPEIDELFPHLWGGAAHAITLRPLGKKAGEKLVQHVLGKLVAADTMARIVAQSEGNALFLEELIRAAAEGRGDEAPATVVAMLQARVARLPPEARRALRAASVFGQTCWRGGVGALLGGASSGAEIERGIAALLREEILEDRRESRFAGEHEYRFRHALMRDAAYSLLADEDRTIYHLRAAEYLRSRGEPDAWLLAEHFLQGRDRPRAITYLVRAAEQACEANDVAGMHAAADRGLSCGAEGVERGVLLSFQVDRYLWGQHYKEALDMSAEAVRLLPAGGRRWCSAIQYLFAAANYLQRTDLSAELMQRFANAYPAADALSEYARAAGWLVASLAAEGKKDDARLFLERARRIGAALPPDDVVTRAHVRVAESVDHFTLEEAPWSLMRCNLEARDALRAAGEQRMQLLLSGSYASALLELGDARGAEAEIRDAMARAERLQDSLPAAFAKAHLADILARTAPLDGLDEPLRLAHELLETRNARLARSARAVLAELKRRLGDLPGAEIEARAVREGVRPFPGHAWEAIASLSQIVRERGGAAEALALAEEGVRDLERLGLSARGELDLRLALVEALLALGRPGDAAAALAAALHRLKRRLADIPERQWRDSYLTHVPVHAKLLALARERLDPDELAALASA